MAKKKKATRKKKARVNKSQVVRDYMAANPEVGPKGVSAALKKKGIKVSPQMVSTIKTKAKKKSSGKKRGRPAKKKLARRAGGLNIDTLVKAKKLADRMGGVDKAKEALDALAKLV